MENVADDISSLSEIIIRGTNAESALVVLSRIEKFLPYINISIDENKQTSHRVLCVIFDSLQKRTFVESLDYCCLSFRAIESLMRKQFGLEAFSNLEGVDVCRNISKAINFHKYNSEIAVDGCACVTSILRFYPNFTDKFVENGFFDNVLFFTQCYLNKTPELTAIICTCLSITIKNSNEPNCTGSKPEVLSKIRESSTLCNYMLPIIPTFISNIETTVAIFEAINGLCDNETNNINLFMENGLGSSIFDILQNHEDPTVISAIFNTLKIITKFRKWIVHLDLSGDLNLCDLVTTCVQKYTSNPSQCEIVASWCNIITNISSIRSVRKKLIQMDVLKLIELSLTHENPLVRYAVCETIATIGSDFLVTQRFEDVGISLLLLECCRASESSQEVQEAETSHRRSVAEDTRRCVGAACAALAVLSKYSAATLGEHGACEVVLGLIRRFSGDGFVLSRAYFALRELILGCQGNADRFLSITSSEIVRSLLLHSHEPDVWEHGVAALFHLMNPKTSLLAPPPPPHENGETVSTVDSESDECLDLCNVILRAFKDFRENRNIIINTSWCILTIFDTNKNVSKLLCRTGLSDSIVEVLRSNLKVPRIVERCCDVIRVLLMEVELGQENRHNLLCAGALETMTSSISQCPIDAEAIRAAAVSINLLLTVGGDTHLLKDRIAYADTYTVLINTLRLQLSPDSATTFPSSFSSAPASPQLTPPRSYKRGGLETQALFTLLFTLVKEDALELKVDQIGMTGLLLQSLEEFATSFLSNDSNADLFVLVNDAITAIQNHEKGKGLRKRTVKQYQNTISPGVSGSIVAEDSAY